MTLPCVLFGVLFFIVQTLHADTLQEVRAADSAVLPYMAADSLQSDDSSTVLSRVPADTSANPESTMVTSVDSTEKRGTALPAEDADTTKLIIGWYRGFGCGWSLGGFDLMRYWEQALPDSLARFDLADTSFVKKRDSTTTDTLFLSDTARLKFSVKEKPSVYTICFPLFFSLTRLSETRRISFALQGAWMRKVYTATIGLQNDTTGISCDYKQSINIYSLFLTSTFGTAIPSEYFAIDGIERCYFVCGIDLSPLVGTAISYATRASSHERMQQVKKTIVPEDRWLHGGAGAIRIGLSMVRRINKKHATDAGIYYTMQGYGLFYESGDRVAFDAIDSDHRKKDKSLYWYSSRFELSIALLRCTEH